jgi:ActR/RegA family two-component response regulator
LLICIILFHYDINHSFAHVLLFQHAVIAIYINMACSLLIQSNENIAQIYKHPFRMHRRSELRCVSCMEHWVLPESKTKLLIVEIDDAFRRHLVERLHMENFKVYEACQETEAKQILQRKIIDVVLLGMREFKQGGLMFLKTIKEIKPLIEVILMTPAEGITLFASIQAMKLGAFDELHIPFDMKKLIERITAARQRKQEREKAKKTIIQDKPQDSDA